MGCSPKKGLFGGKKSQTINLDASCLLLDASGNLVDQAWFVDYKASTGQFSTPGTIARAKVKATMNLSSLI